MSSKVCLPLSALLLAFFSTFVVAAPLSQYRIFLPEGSTKAEQQAASELQEYVRKCAKIELPIVISAGKASEASAPCFVIGPAPEALAALALASADDLKRDEIYLKSAPGGTLFLGGARPRGTLYAVYEFLEKTMGVRWLTPEVTITPECPADRKVPDWDYRYRPEISIRHTDAQTNRGNQLFYSHMRLNGGYTPSAEQFGGVLDVSFMPPFVHSFDYYVPCKTHFDAHPGWFSYRRDPFRKAGRRRDSQLCLTNRELRAELLARVLENVRNHPGYGFVSISQNDNTLFCQCAKCRKFVNEHGNLTDLYLDAVNEIADAVKAEFPEMMVEMLAYRFTRHPPKTIRPRDNIVIRTCTIEAASFQTLETPGPNSKLCEDITGWKNIAKQQMVWDYVTVFKKYWQPHPNWKTLAPNLRFFRDNGVISVFEQAPGNGGGVAADFPELRNYLLCKLMWNPDEDDRKIMAEFVNLYYGPLADYVGRTIQLLSDLAAGSDNCYTVTTKGWLPDDLLRDLWLEGEELRQKYADDTTYGPRIDAAVLPLAMSAMERHLAPPSPWTFDDYANDIVRRLENLGVKTLTEHDTSPGYTPKLWRELLD